jgi:hypothetical protein
VPTVDRGVGHCRCPCCLLLLMEHRPECAVLGQRIFGAGSDRLLTRR